MAGEMAALEFQFNQCAISPPPPPPFEEEEAVVAAGDSDEDTDVDEVIAYALEGEEQEATYFRGPPLPVGKVLITPLLVDKILALQRKKLSNLDMLDAERPWWRTPEEHKRWSDTLRRAAEAFDSSQDDFVECQSMIRDMRHPVDGYALVDDTVEVITTINRVLYGRQDGDEDDVAFECEYSSIEDENEEED
uniref:Uncharacterized protein n=1 Tax=Leersia perrieri TaxID=77586 RepID=A0A0D9XUA7_9ORYZ